MRNAQRSGWALALVSAGIAVLALLAAEVGLRLAGVEPLPWPSAGKGYSFFRGLRVDPLLGVLPTPGWSGTWMSGFKVEVDAQGFRATGYPPPATAGLRVTFLGDSCTFGWGLDTPDTFLAQLDKRRAETTADIELINAATPGMSAVSGLYLLRQRILPLRPNVVVLGFSANNAFRFSVVSDAERFRFFGVRQLLFRSRLFHVLAARAASMRGPEGDPRAPKAVNTTPLPQLHRVAAPDEFEAATRAMVADSRAVGAEVILLLFPRASQITPKFQNEDAAYLFHNLPVPERPGFKAARDITLLQFSCLDHRQLADPIQTLHQQVPRWQSVYPTDVTLIAILRRGAEAYVRGDYTQALAEFTHAVERQPTSPLARYNRGVAALALGDRETGWRELLEADRLACSAFMQYAVVLWKIAIDLDVRVVDLLLYFQARGDDTLFRDAAHPSAAGAQIIADALWPVLSDAAHLTK